MPAGLPVAQWTDHPDAPAPTLTTYSAGQVVQVAGPLVTERRLYSPLGVIEDVVVSRGNEHERTRFDARGNPVGVPGCRQRARAHPLRRPGQPGRGAGVQVGVLAELE